MSGKVILTLGRVLSSFPGGIGKHRPTGSTDTLKAHMGPLAEPDCARKLGHGRCMIDVIHACAVVNIVESESHTASKFRLQPAVKLLLRYLQRERLRARERARGGQCGTLRSDALPSELGLHVALSGAWSCVSMFVECVCESVCVCVCVFACANMGLWVCSAVCWQPMLWLPRRAVTAASLWLPHSSGPGPQLHLGPWSPTPFQHTPARSHGHEWPLQAGRVASRHLWRPQGARVRVDG